MKGKLYSHIRLLKSIKQTTNTSENMIIRIICIFNYISIYL